MRTSTLVLLTALVPACAQSSPEPSARAESEIVSAPLALQEIVGVVDGAALLATAAGLERLDMATETRTLLGPSAWNLSPVVTSEGKLAYVHQLHPSSCSTLPPAQQDKCWELRVGTVAQGAPQRFDSPAGVALDAPEAGAFSADGRYLVLVAPEITDVFPRSRHFVVLDQLTGAVTDTKGPPAAPFRIQAAPVGRSFLVAGVDQAQTFDALTHALGPNLGLGVKLGTWDGLTVLAEGFGPADTYFVESVSSATAVKTTLASSTELTAAAPLRTVLPVAGGDFITADLVTLPPQPDAINPQREVRIVRRSRSAAVAAKVLHRIPAGPFFTSVISQLQTMEVAGSDYLLFESYNTFPGALSLVGSVRLDGSAPAVTKAGRLHDAFSGAALVDDNLVNAATLANVGPSLANTAANESRINGTGSGLVGVSDAEVEKFDVWSAFGAAAPIKEASIEAWAVLRVPGSPKILVTYDIGRKLLIVKP